MENKLCIHCSQPQKCMFQDGIFCTSVPCVIDNPEKAGFQENWGDEFVKKFSSIFGGGIGDDDSNVE